MYTYEYMYVNNNMCVSSSGMKETLADELQSDQRIYCVVLRDNDGPISMPLILTGIANSRPNGSLWIPATDVVELIIRWCSILINTFMYT